MSEDTRQTLSAPFGAVRSGYQPPFVLPIPFIPQGNFLFWVRLWVRRRFRFAGRYPRIRSHHLRSIAKQVQYSHPRRSLAATRRPSYPNSHQGPVLPRQQYQYRCPFCFPPYMGAIEKDTAHIHRFTHGGGIFPGSSQRFFNRLMTHKANIEETPGFQHRTGRLQIIFSASNQ